MMYLLNCLQKTAPPVLIFCENKADVDDIHEYLLLKGASRTPLCTRARSPPHALFWHGQAQRRMTEAHTCTVRLGRGMSHSREGRPHEVETHHEQLISRRLAHSLWTANHWPLTMWQATATWPRLLLA